MSSRNVGDVEATLRLVVASVLAGVTTATAFYVRTPTVAVGIVVALVCAVLLAKSAITHHCPIHERTGVDTSDA